MNINIILIITLVELNYLGLVKVANSNLKHVQLAKP